MSDVSSREGTRSVLPSTRVPTRLILSVKALEE